MQPRHTSQIANASLPKSSYGIRTRAGTINQLSFDGFGRLAQLKYKSPNQQTLLQRQYQYDPNTFFFNKTFE